MTTPIRTTLLHTSKVVAHGAHPAREQAIEDFFGRRRRAAEQAGAMVKEGVTLGAAGHHERGLAVLDQVLERHTSPVEQALRKVVADALYNKGVILSVLQRRADRRRIWEELAQRFGDDEDPATRCPVARGLFNLAASLREEGNHDEAAVYYRQLVVRFREDKEQETWIVVSDALSNLCHVLAESGRSEEALSVAAMLLERLDGSRAKRLRGHRINALGVTYDALSALGRHEEALPRLRDALRELTGYAGPDRVERTVSLLNNQGTSLVQLGRLKEAEECFDASFEASAGSAEPEVMRTAALALTNKSLVQAHLGDEGELATLSTIVDRFAGKPDPRLTGLAARALARSRHLLEHKGRTVEARAAQDRLESFAVEMRDADEKQLVARVLMNHALRTQNLTDKVEMLDAAVASLEKHPGAGRDDLMIAQALSAKAIELARNEHLGEAIAAWDEAVEQLSGRQDNEATQVIARALVDRAGALNNLGCIEGALSGFAEVVSRFGSRRGEQATSAVTTARDSAAKVQQCRQENLAASAPAVTLPDVLSLLRAAVPKRDQSAPVPHFVNANLIAETSLLRLAYAARDRRKLAEQLTGLSLVGSLFKRIEKETGQLPAEIYVESSVGVLGGSLDRDANYALTLESMAVLGLPLRAAVRHTHIGSCARLFGYDVTIAACCPGMAVAVTFGGREGAR